MKHAFLIIAHSEPELFSILISLLDNQDIDIYVHIDKKADITLFDKVKTAHSRIFFIDDRIDVKWGHYSQIQTEMKLFESAHRTQEYAYYHLLSGVDLPIMPIGDIIDWFDRHSGYEYLGGQIPARKYHKRMHHRYFFITRKRNIATTIILAFEKLLGLKWNKDTEVRMSSNWGSFTHEFISELLAHKEWIENHFKYSFCGDELYKATLMRHLRIEDRDKGSVRLIDWTRGNPYIWKEGDLDEIITSGKLFARKFSSSEMNIVRQIRTYITKHE